MKIINYFFIAYFISILPANAQLFGGQIKTKNPLLNQYPAGSVFCNGPTAIVDVTSPTGKIWMDRNLGASRAATSSNDANSYGDLYQWGRRSDGHQCRTSPTTYTPSSIDQPTNDNFILTNTAPNDWRTPQNTNLWQGVNGVNNPCPTGYRLPTETEINAERLSWSANTSAGAFASLLKLPVAGGRLYFQSGSLTSVNSTGYYWSSTVSDTNSQYINFTGTWSEIFNSRRAYGFSVRCIKDASAIPPTVGALNCGSTSIIGTLTSGTAASGVSAAVPYTGGNGGSYLAQSISSTGVTGLTATLSFGTLAFGSGSFSFAISGTPSSSGTASFALNIGGQTCSINISVANLTSIAIPPTVGALNCGSTSIIGTLTSGTAASGVSAAVPYTGGNGGSYLAQSISSTGVTGLTATLSFGTLAFGSGSFSFAISGTPSSSGTASFALNIGGQTCSINISVANLTSIYPIGSIFCNGPTAIVDVINPTTGKTWMDRNLGANQAATDIADANAYGDLYQWGRRSDGHQCRNSGTTNILSSTDQPTHGLFITYNIVNTRSDWRSPSNDNLWQGVSGINNPCPNGYRLPTKVEFFEEKNSWINSLAENAFLSPLKLTKAGSRWRSDGSFNPVVIGNYWTSSADLPVIPGSGSTKSTWVFQFGTLAVENTYGRAEGFSVRCIKDASAIIGSIGTINCGTATNTGTLTQGTAASGVSSSIPYTGGNGGSHSGQTITSSGVTGLTATLSSGAFANGSGSIVYNITGTPSSSGIASFALTLGGQSCSFTISVQSALAAQYPAGSVFCNGPTAIVDIINPTTGKTWMDRNLGASRVATSSTDALAYGDLYQWGRGSDGHQCRNSTTITTLSISDQPGHGNFILSPNTPNDWRNPQNTNLWQGINGLNNPCPTGYRVPTQIELDNERLSWPTNNDVGAFNSQLKFTIAGLRSGSDNSLNNVGWGGTYWTSSVSGNNSLDLDFGNSTGFFFNGSRSLGMSVRCIKN